MIPTALTIKQIADCLGGDVLTANMARAPGPFAEPDDRSLMVLKVDAGLVVVPKADGDFRSRERLKSTAEAHVARKLSDAKCYIITFGNSGLLNGEPVAETGERK